MKLKAIFLSTLLFALALVPGIASAGNLGTLVETGVLRLSDNQKWEQSYETAQGKFKIRFRKLWNSSSQKRYHLIIWWDKKRIADGYCPENSGGYAFDIYQDKVTGRLFVALKTNWHVQLMGYEPTNGRLEKYADSRNYYSPIPNPRMGIDRDGDVQLSFIGDGKGIPTTYKLFWDEPARWFGYKDTTYRPAPQVSQPSYTPSYTPSYAPSYYEEDYGYEEPSYSLEEELYSEESVVVGS